MGILLSDNSGENNQYQVLGQTIQLYITGNCAMECTHCSSKDKKIGNMELEEFKKILTSLKSQGVKRVELFANDPIQHPQIFEFINELNKSGLDYAILTVGESPKNYKPGENSQKFDTLLQKISQSNGKGGLVFSVDYTDEDSDKIFNKGRGTENPNWDYAFKAKVFWDNIENFKKYNIAIRVNIVISPNNLEEVDKIAEKVAKEGFGVSFCFEQNVHNKFTELKDQKSLSSFEQEYREFIKNTGLLSAEQIDSLIEQSRAIVESGDFESFNNFRGDGEVQEKVEGIESLREKLLALKNNPEFGNKILPGEDFIKGLGEEYIGCINMLKNGKIPCLKIGTKGELIFCCDLHDKKTSETTIHDLSDVEKRKTFLDIVRNNPYIWLCLFFNPCSFSVNYVQYTTIASTNSLLDFPKEDDFKKLPLKPEQLEKIKEIIFSSNNLHTLSDDKKNIVSSDPISDEELQVILKKDNWSLEDAYKVLRYDYLSTQNQDKGTKNIRVSKGDFLQASNVITQRLSQYLFEKMGCDKEKTIPILPLGAGIAFEETFQKEKISNIGYIGIRRDEQNPHKNKTYLPLSFSEENLLQEGKDLSEYQFIIADPMLATGGTIFTVVEEMKRFGIKEEQITVSSIISAPEGIYRVLQKYPRIKILSGSIDNNLDGNGFISPGLGDYGDKIRPSLQENIDEILEKLSK